MRGRMAGRPTKLTPEVQRTIVEILHNGGTRSVAAGRAHIDLATFRDWMRRGEQATSGRYYDFLIAVKDAEAQAELMAWRTIHLAIVGGWYKVPMRDKDGNYVFKRDPITGEILRDAHGRPEAELVDEYKEPDAECACWFLERRDPANWGKGGGEGVTLNVSAAPMRPEPSKREFLDLLREAVQILVDNGMDSPKPKTKPRDQKAIEMTATRAGSGEKTGA